MSVVIPNDNFGDSPPERSGSGINDSNNPTSSGILSNDKLERLERYQFDRLGQNSHPSRSRNSPGAAKGRKGIPGFFDLASCAGVMKPLSVLSKLSTLTVYVL